MNLGDVVVIVFGLKVKMIKMILLILVVILVGFVILVVGGISFLGLIVFYIVR